MPSTRSLPKRFPSPASLLVLRWLGAGLALAAGVLLILHGSQAHGHRRTMELLLGFFLAPSALAYLGFDVFLIFMERSIRDGFAAPETNSMYTTIPHLQSAIRVSLQKGQLCRVYQESLNACWPHLSDDAQADKVARFALQHHWVVSFRQLGSLGLVAEFQKTEADVPVGHN